MDGFIHTMSLQLTDKCKKSLSRIFRLCDLDNDGCLSDTELSLFQRRCFHMDLESGTLDSLKAVVQKSCPSGLTKEGLLNAKGFLALNGLFIQRGRHETTWTILRRFGYDDDLNLHREFLYPSLKVPQGCSVELSHEGYDFLTAVFEKYDQDGDRALNPQELVNLFSTCPVMPWGPEVYNTAPVSDKGWISLHGYLGLWTLATLLDTRQTLEYLAYLGYTYYTGEETALPALQVTRDRRADLGAKRQTTRNVYRCHVIGPRDAGKTTFCQGLLGRGRREAGALRPGEVPRNTVNTVTVYGQEKYLVLEDIDVRHLNDALMPAEVLCDVCCLVYDVANPRSFEFVARIYLVRIFLLQITVPFVHGLLFWQKYYANSKIPILVCGNKSELPAVRQDYILQPEAFCSKHKVNYYCHLGSLGSLRFNLVPLFPASSATTDLNYKGSQEGHLCQAGHDGGLPVSTYLFIRTHNETLPTDID